MSTFRPVGERTVFEGYILKVAVATFAGPDGITFERDVIRHPGAVAVAPIAGDEIVLVRQYRSALDDYVLEIPAGLRDIADEAPAETARRELAEEVGLVAGSLEPLTSIHNAVGYCDEVIDIFIATDLRAAPHEPTDSPEEADMDIVRIRVADGMSMIWSGEITDAKTIIALLAVSNRSFDA